MEILIQLNEKTLLVQPKGKLDSNTSTEFEEKVNLALTNEVEKLVIDFANIDFISSKGLRVLVSIFYKLEGKTMIIKNPNASVSEVMKLSGLSKVFNIE